jgi:hypothetical protein
MPLAYFAPWVRVYWRIIKIPRLKPEYFYGGRGGTRTLKPYRQRILSPQRIPIPPLARIEACAFVSFCQLWQKLRPDAMLLLSKFQKQVFKILV